MPYTYELKVYQCKMYAYSKSKKQYKILILLNKKMEKHVTQNREAQIEAWRGKL